MMDITIAFGLAINGLAMAPLSASVVEATLATSRAFALALNLVKWPEFLRLGCLTAPRGTGR